MTVTRWAANLIACGQTEHFQTKEGPTSHRCGSRRMDAPRCRSNSTSSASSGGGISPERTKRNKTRTVSVAPIWSFPAPQYKILTHQRLRLDNSICLEILPENENKRYINYLFVVVCGQDSKHFLDDALFQRNMLRTKSLQLPYIST